MEHVVLVRARSPHPFCYRRSSLQTFPSLLKTWGAVLVTSGACQPKQGLGACPEGRRLAATPLSSRHLAPGSRNPETWPCACRPRSLIGLDALRKSGPAMPLPPGSRPGYGRHGYSRQSGLEGGPGRSRVSGTISSSGRRRDTGHSVQFCDQVLAGEARGGAAAPRAYSHRLRSRLRPAPGRGLAPAWSPPLRRCPPVGGGEAGPGAPGSAGPSGSPFM